MSRLTPLFLLLLVVAQSQHVQSQVSYYRQISADIMAREPVLVQRILFGFKAILENSFCILLIKGELLVTGA